MLKEQLHWETNVFSLGTPKPFVARMRRDAPTYVEKGVDVAVAVEDVDSRDNRAYETAILSRAIKDYLETVRLHKELRLAGRDCLRFAGALRTTLRTNPLARFCI